MGGKASKEEDDTSPAYNTNGTGTNGNPPTKKNSSIQSVDSEDDDCVCSFPSLFCPPSNDSNSHTHRKGGKYDPIGTPLPDTPMAVRRRRIMDQGRDADVFSTKYEGLEKEVSIRGLGMEREEVGEERRSNGGSSHGGVPFGDWDRQPSAEIHEGKDTERELYAKYDLLEVLGVGSTSTCHRCINRHTQQSYACKVIDKKQIEQRFKGMIEQFHTEIQALRSLHHPNIIRLFDVYITNEKIYIIMEMMEGGELFDYVVKKGTLTEEEASSIVRKVTSALVYMHAKNIIHRDLKPENLLLTRKPRTPLDDIEVKIIDFGLSKCMHEPVARSFLGTRGYLAPEMLQRRDYSRAVDAWALGVITFVLLCGCLPFDDDANSIPTDDILQKKFTLRFPRWAKNISPSAKDLLAHLLDVNSRTRYTAEQALMHPWVRGESAPKESLLQSPARIRTSPATARRNNRNHASPHHHPHQHSRHSRHYSKKTHKHSHHTAQQHPDDHDYDLASGSRSGGGTHATRGIRSSAGHLGRPVLVRKQSI